MSSGNDIIISPEPLKPRIERLRTLPGNTLAGALRCAIANEKLNYTDLPRVDIKVNGVLQPKTAEALDRCLMDGDLVVIDVRVHGDNPLRTAFQIFVQVAAAVVGTFFGPWASAAVQVAGALLTNVLFPPNKPEQLADANDSGALRDQSNSIRRRYPMPLVLGRQRIGFDVAALGYSENIGDESWINVIFGLHYGPCTVEDIKIGETLLDDYPANDYQIEYFLVPGPRNSNIYKQSKFQENLNNELTFVGNNGTWEVGTLQPNVNQGEVDITMPNGIHFTDDKGRKGNEELTGTIQIAEVGTENWIPGPGMPVAYNKNNQALPPGSFYINAKTQDAIRRTYRFNCPDPTKQYKVRVRAYDSENLSKGTQVWDIFWTALRSVSFQKPIIDETLSCVVMRVRSSGDLNGTLPTVTGVVTPIVPIFSGGNWNTSAPSSNMAACLRWALTGPPANTPLDPDEINESCATAYSLIEANDWKAGIFIIEDLSQEDLMKVCGAAGRFSTYWTGEDLAFVSDWAKPIPRQIFTHKNVSGYKYRREYQDEIHAVFVEFKNLDESSGADEVWVYADGYTAANATEFETMRLPYACTLERAYKEGRVYLAKRELKTEVHEFTAGFDGVTATYGDRVLVSHPAALFGKAAGRVVNRIFNEDKTQVVGMRVDFLAEFEPGLDYSVDVRRFDQAFVGISVVNPGTQSKTITFTAPRPVADAPLKDDLVVFGETNIVTEDVEIDDFNYADSSSVRISASPYVADLVEIAETGPIPDITTSLKPKQPTPKPRIISSRGLPDGAEVLFDVIEDPAVPIQGFVAKWRYSGGSWNTLPLLGSDARSVKTPPIQRPSYEVGDPEADAKTLVDIQILTLARRGDYSNPVYANGIIIEKFVLEPTGFDAIGVVRTSPDSSAYPAIAVIADATTAGDVQYVDVEIAVSEEDPLFGPAGQPLPASNPVGDYSEVQAGETYLVRARNRTQDNWVSEWVYSDAPVEVPGNSNVSTDTVNVGGVPSGDLLGRVVYVEDLTAALDLASSNAGLAIALLDTRLDAVDYDLDDPTTGLKVRVGEVETVAEDAASRVGVVEVAINQPGTGLSAVVAELELATLNLELGKADATRVTLIEANVSGKGWLHPNAEFTNYPRTDYPEWWATADVQSVFTKSLRVAGDNGTYAWRVYGDGGLNVFSGGMSDNGTFRPGQYVVVEADFTHLSGDLLSSGVYMRGYDAVGTPADWSILLPFSTAKDTTGVAPGAGVVGRRYSFRFPPILITGTTTEKALIYAMTHWASMGPLSGVILDWHRLGVRPATPAEIEVGQATAGGTSLTARYVANELATANLATGKADVTKVQVLEARSNSANLLRRSQFFNPVFSPWTTDHNLSGGISAYVHPTLANGPGNGELAMVMVGFSGVGYMQWQSELVSAEQGRYVGSHKVFVGGSVAAVQTFLVAYNAAGEYLAESPPGPAVNGAGIGALGNWGNAYVFLDAPVGTAFVRLIMRVTTGGGYAELWTLRPMLAKATAEQTEPSEWTPGAVEGRLAITEKVAVDAATQLSTVSFDIVAAAGDDPAAVQVRADSTGSLVGLIASALKFSNILGGTIVEVMKLVGGIVYISGKLVMGALAQIELDPSIPAIIWKIGTAKLFIGQAPADGLVFWFGPDMSTSAMRKNNATFWLDTSGNGYFGGTLRSGTLYSSARFNFLSRTVSAATSFLLTHFGSNGDPKSVLSTMTYSQTRSEVYSSESSANSVRTSWLAGANPGTLSYRVVRAGVTLGEWTVNRTLTAFVGSDGGGDWTVDYGYSYNASNTLTDTYAVSGDVPYVIEITGSTGGAITTGVGGDNYEEGQFSLAITEE